MPAAIAHRLAHGLLASIRHRSANDDVRRARPARQSDAECGQQRAEKRDAVASSQFPRGAPEIGGYERNRSLQADSK